MKKLLLLTLTIGIFISCENVNSKKYLIKGAKTYSKTINLITVESNISKEIRNIQTKWKKTVEIGSYPFFRLGKIGVSLVLRSINQNKINAEFWLVENSYHVDAVFKYPEVYSKKMEEFFNKKLK